MTSTRQRASGPARAEATQAAERSQAARHAPVAPAARTVPALLGALQQTAGNAAVARTVQRLADGAPKAPPAGPAGPAGARPHEDPRFLAVRAKVVRESTLLAQQHPPPAAEARMAQ